MFLYRPRHGSIGRARLTAIMVGLLLGLAPTGCAQNPRPELFVKVDSRRCEDAAAFLEANRRGASVRGRVKQVLALPLSYVATGLGYATDVVLVVGGGIVVGGAICSPLIALDVASGGTASGECISAVMQNFESTENLPGVGRGIYAATDSWRCVDLTPLSQELRAVARCYAERAETDDLEKAIAQLRVLRQSKDLYRCVTDQERRAINDDLQSVMQRREAATGSTDSDGSSD